MGGRLWARALLTTSVVSGVTVLLVLGVVVWPMRDSRPYAEQVFDGVMRYDRILASKASFVSDDGWGCTFAIVELSSDAGVAPVAQAAQDRSWRNTWGGAWIETPVTHPGPRQRDALYDCADEWPPGVYKMLRSAIETPGSFYLRDEVGEIVMIYSRPYRLAARVRSGD
jgi:hypothetical protein